jgi:hypothetical protein
MNKTADKRARMYAKIEQHGKNINAIFGTDYEPVTISKKLFSLENKMHNAALDYCNLPDQEDNYRKTKTSVLKSLHKLLGDKIPLEVNADPRGYALKIPDDYVCEHDLQIHRDWGGYGILAPNYSED